MNELLSEAAVAASSALGTEEKIRAAERLVQSELERATGDVCVTNSFQAEDMVVLHMVRQTLPRVPVVFLDTGYHFAEVYAYRDRMAEAWGMNLINLLPELTVPEQEARFGRAQRPGQPHGRPLRRLTEDSPPACPALSEPIRFLRPVVDCQATTDVAGVYIPLVGIERGGFSP